MIINQLRLIVVSTTFLIGMTSAVYGQNDTSQEAASTLDIATISCRSLLKLSDSDQEATISYFQGFISGRNNELTVDVVRLGEISEQVVELCIDNPNDSLLSVFEQQRNNLDTRTEGGEEEEQ